MAKIKNREQRGLTPDRAQQKSTSARANGGSKPGSVRKLPGIGGRGWLIAGIIALVALGTLGASLKYLETDARRQAANRKLQNSGSQETSLLNAVNPFLPPPTPVPAPQLSKEYIYAGGKMLAVEDSGANAAPPADLAVWRPSNGTWYVLGGQGSQQTSLQWGQSGDRPAIGDFDGDGKTDFSVYRASTAQTNGHWYILQSSTGTFLDLDFGLGSDKLAQADYDGDGKTDAAVFRESNGYWFIRQSSTGNWVQVLWGLSTDIQAPADYDGDGKADIAVWRAGTAANSYVSSFYIVRSSDNGFQSINLGLAGDTPVPADYDGDGRADAAVRSGSNWLILNSSSGSNAQPTSISWQQAGDKAVQNDYDGDGKVDIAVWRESSGTWYIRKSSDNSTRTEQWGTVGDIPVPAFYRR